jgi:hypothetical protein
MDIYFISGCFDNFLKELNVSLLRLLICVNKKNVPACTPAALREAQC